MSGERIARAIARIETAARRIEAAAPMAGAGKGAGEGEMARKYHALRAEADRALAQLDTLIGKITP